MKINRETLLKTFTEVRFPNCNDLSTYKIILWIKKKKENTKFNLFQIWEDSRSAVWAEPMCC